MATNDKNETFQHMGSLNKQEEETQIRKKRRSFAKGKFHRVYNKFKLYIQEEEPMSVLQELLVDLEKSYNETENQTDNYMELLDDDKDARKIKELQDDMEVLYRELYDIKSWMSRQKAKFLDTRTVPETAPKTTLVGAHGLKVKKLDAPEFSGNIRDYPSFKRDYERHMMSSYGQDPFALKKCLSGDALRTVKCVDDDFTEMFHRLDIKYGRPEKQADAVLNEIKKLKPIAEGDDRAFVNTVDIIENCYLDLKKINLEAEMNTATMVSEIEKLLPRIQRREWAIKKQRNLSYKNAFDIFLEFLLEEKYAIEYMENDLRTSDKTQKGKIHSTSVDSEKITENKTNLSNLQSRLDRHEAMLQQVMHGIAELTRTGPTKNSLIKKCWYHDTDGHEIGDCAAFKQLDLKSKFDILRKNGGCFSCLRPGHLSSKCKNRNMCTVVGCEQMHHSTLHNFETREKSCNNIVNGSNLNNEGVLLMMSEVKCRQGKLNTLWDPGANMSLITHRAARQMGLKGKPITLSLTKVGNITEKFQSRAYVVPLMDNSGQEWTVHAYGIEQVTSEIGQFNVANVTKLFKGITEKDIKRPTGSVGFSSEQIAACFYLKK